MEDNFFDDIQELPQGSTGDAMVRAVNKRRIHEENLAKLEEELKAEKEEINRLDLEEMPKLLKEMGSSVWRHPEEPIQVELVASVDAKQPKEMDKRVQMFQALDEIGVYEIVGQEFTLVFSPGDRKAIILRAVLGLAEDPLEDQQDVKLSNYEWELIHRFRKELKIEELPAEEKVGIHPSTFRSWLTKKIDAGFGNIVEAAGIWHGKKAKISAVKGKKK